VLRPDGKLEHQSGSFTVFQCSFEHCKQLVSALNFKRVSNLPSFDADKFL